MLESGALATSAIVLDSSSEAQPWAGCCAEDGGVTTADESFGASAESPKNERSSSRGWRLEQPPRLPSAKSHNVAK
jgi:hypothetical protein